MHSLSYFLRYSLNVGGVCFLVVVLSLAITLQANAAPNRLDAVREAPPAMRLDDAVKPLAYDVELTVVPTKEKFAGRIVIHLELAKPTKFFWLNATQLDIHGATLVASGALLLRTPQHEPLGVAMEILAAVCFLTHALRDANRSLKKR